MHEELCALTEQEMNSPLLEEVSVSPGDHVVGQASDSLRRLVCLVGKYERTLQDLGTASLHPCFDPAKREQSAREYERLSLECAILRNACVINLHDAFPILWGKPSWKVCSGWQIAWSDDPVESGFGFEGDVPRYSSDRSTNKTFRISKVGNA